MTTGATGQLGLALPVQGELSGTWGNTVNNGITEYTNIAIAGTLTLTDDGAVTLANTTGDASASNITSSLTGAGTVTAQFAIVKVTGTLTAAKVVTAPSYSKTYVVDNTTATYAVTFKASGQTGVSIVAGEKATVYFNGTDYVKVASTTADGVTTFSAGTTGFTPSTATSGAVTLSGTLATANGGTNLTSFTANGVVYASSTSVLATGSALTFNASTLAIATAANDQLTWTGGRTGYLYADSAGIGIGDTALLAGNNTYYNKTSNYIANYINGTEGMRLTSTGLGIGTNSPNGKLNVAGAQNANLVSLSDTSAIRWAWYLSSNALRLYNYATSSDAMTLDASGNLGVGTTSPQATIVAAGSNATVYRAMILRNGNGADGSSATIDFETSTGTQGDEAAMAGRIAGLRTGSGTSGALTFSTTNAGVLGERARIDSAGYLSGVWADEVTALGNSGTATTITCTSGNVFTSTLTGNCTFTLSAPSTTTANTATSFTLILTNDGTAGRTVAFSGGTFKYPGGSVTRTTAANAVDIWFFFSPNGGTTWYVSIPMANLS